MSLGCNECHEDMGPSDNFPGREGMLVHPVLISLSYLPTNEGIDYEKIYLQASQDRSLCFRCIENKLSSDRKDILNKIYQTYESEIEFRKIEENQKGRWINGEESSFYLEMYDLFENNLKSLEDNCLFCGKNVKDGRPFFNALVIDKVFSEQHLSGLFVNNNYSYSNLEEGRTFLNICFDDFRKNFPKSYESLSYDLSGKKNPNSKSGVELYISPEAEKALFKETGKTIVEIMKEVN